MGFVTYIIGYSDFKSCQNDLKGLVHPKMKIMSLMTALKSFKARKTSVHLQNTV